MKRFFCILAIVMMALSTIAQPRWTRKYENAVVKGRLTNLPDSIQPNISQWGSLGEANIKGEFFASRASIDSTGEFCYEWDMSWPTSHSIGVCDIRTSLLLCPGDTFDIVIDYPKALELKDEPERRYSEAVTIRGGSLPHSPKYMALRNKLAGEAALIQLDQIKENCTKGFEPAREWQWQEHRNRLKQIKKAKITRQEKNILRLMMEQKYVEKLYRLAWLMEIAKCDSTEIATFKAQFTRVDPHVRSLTFYKSLAGAYAFSPGYMDYLVDNNLDGSPLGRYFKERQRAEGVVSRVKAFKSVSDAEIDSLAPEFRRPVRDLRADIAAKMPHDDGEWKPTGEASEWLQQMVEHHSGRVVYIDFWATWCGPCQQGIREMEKVKADYEKRGVDFVYVTDDSSNPVGFIDMKKTHSGEHFLFTKDEIKAMQIPGYGGSIPHYLIYDRNGNLVNTITGWRGLEAMTQALDKALGE